MSNGMMASARTTIPLYLRSRLQRRLQNNNEAADQFDGHYSVQLNHCVSLQTTADITFDENDNDELLT
jgi:hypothetical protein